MIGYLVSLASIVLMAVMIWGLVRQVRKEQPLTTWTPALGLAMAPVMLLINLLFLRKAIPALLGPALLVLGLGLGLAWGQTTRLEAKGNAIVAKRSVLHLIFWGISFAITQILAVFAPAAWVSAGLAAMFFSTGTTVGTNLNLLVRRLRIAKDPPAASLGPERAGPLPPERHG